MAWQASFFIPSIVQNILNIVGRFIAYGVANYIIIPKYENLTLEEIIKQMLPESRERDELIELITKHDLAKRPATFVEFLKNFNLDLARTSILASAVDPTLGRMTTQLLNAISWSYGFGWLSWMGLSPILRVAITQPAEQVFNAEFPSKALTRSEVERLFKAKLIDEKTFKTYMKALGYRDEDIDLMISTLKEEPKAKERDLTKSEILRLFREGKLTETDTRLRLRELGYSSDEVQLLIELYKPAQEAEKSVRERDLTTSQILQAFRYRLITREEAEAWLKELGYDDREVDLLIRIEEVRMQSAVKERTRDLSKTDILSMLAKQLLSPEEAKQMLIDIGYSEEEAELLVINKLIEVAEHG